MGSHKLISLLVVGLVFAASLHLSEAQIGVVYGTQGSNLPTPQEVIALIASNNITRVRLLEPNKDILNALKGKDIEVFLGFPNRNLTTVIDQSVAENWVAVNVKPYVPGVKIKYIVVGNHVSANSGNSLTGVFGLDYMRKLYKALQNQGFKDIKVTTSCDNTLYDQMKKPVPSTVELLAGALTVLNSSFIDARDPGLLAFLAETGTPFMVNMYPAYDLIMHPNGIKPEFALFTAPAGNVVTDGKLSYQNMFDVQLDTFYTIFEQLGHTDIEIIVGETGWSSAGGAHASLENAKTYVTNLIQHLSKGTPKRPNKPIQVFFDLFDEDKIGVAEIDKHLGLFTADGKIKFPVSFNPSA